MIGLHHAGSSPLHRIPAGAKLVGLAAAVTTVALLREPWQLGVALLVTLSLFALARIPPRAALHAVAPVLWVLVLAVPLNALFAGLETAAVMALRVVTAVALAAIVSLTTSVTAILDTITRVLRPLPRVDADRVGLVLALTIRAVPLLGEIVASVFEARKARGVDRSLRAIAVPVIVRSLQTADELGEALVARGVDD